jgi:hypothetical protein
MTTIGKQYTVLTFNGVNLQTNSPADASNVSPRTFSLTIDLFDETGTTPLVDDDALLTDLSISFSGTNYVLVWDSILNKFILAGTSGNITIPNEKIGTVKIFEIFYVGETPENIGSIVYSGLPDVESAELYLSPDDVTYTLQNNNDYYERFRTQFFYVTIDDTAGNSYTGDLKFYLEDGTNQLGLEGNDGRFIADGTGVGGITLINAITASAFPDSIAGITITDLGSTFANRNIKWDGPMLDSSRVVINGITGGINTSYTLNAGKKYPFSLLLVGASGSAPYALNTITQDTLDMIENTSTYPGYSFLPTSTVGTYKLDDQGTGDDRLLIQGTTGVTYSFDISYSCVTYADRGTTLSFNIFVQDAPDASSVGSTMSVKYSSSYIGDINTLYALTLDTAGNTYIPDDTDRLTFYRNGEAFMGSEVAPLTPSNPVFGLEDYVEGTTGGITYSAFLQTGTTGITFSATQFVQVYDIDVALDSPMTTSANAIYSGEDGDGVTLSVVLRNNSGDLYNNTLTNYTMGIYQSVGSTASPFISPYSLSSTGSTYTFFFDAGASNPYNNLLTFSYRLTAVSPYPSTELQSTGAGQKTVVMGPRNVVSASESTLTADPFNVTNRSGVDITLQLLDALGNPVNGGANTSFIQNLQGISFAREFAGAVSPSISQDVGVTGRYTFSFSVSDLVTETKLIPSNSQLTFLASHNGTYINQVETLTYSVNDPSMVPCFFGDAPVLTTKGYVRIDRLKKGDIVVTPDEQQIPIKRVVVSKVSASRETNPYVIPKGMFNATEKLLISPNHKVSVKGRMVESKFLNLRQDYHKGILTYYNIELERYSNMVVAGVNVETLICAKEVYVTPEQFMASLKKRYGNITQELYESTLSKFKVMPDGRIRCFATAKSVK